LETSRILIEDAGSGTPLAQELSTKLCGIIAVKPEGDKIRRMAAASAKLEAGQVMLPERASWLPDLEAELFVFPVGRHDDQYDSISQALSDNNTSFMDWISRSELDDLIGKIQAFGWRSSR
jgi:predicted phage terminase large subunit-like protein